MASEARLRPLQRRRVAASFNHQVRQFLVDADDETGHEAEAEAEAPPKAEAEAKAGAEAEAEAGAEAKAEAEAR